MDATCGRCGAAYRGAVEGDSARCEACAVLEVDEAARLRTRNALKILAAGTVLLVLAAVMWIFKIDLGGDIHDDDGLDLFLYVGFAAVGCFGVGLGMLKFRPRLRL